MSAISPLHNSKRPKKLCPWHDSIVKGLAYNKEPGSNPLNPINAKCENSKRKHVFRPSRANFSIYTEFSADALDLQPQNPLYTEWSERFGAIHWPRVFCSLLTVDLIFRSLHFLYHDAH